MYIIYMVWTDTAIDVYYYYSYMFRCIQMILRPQCQFSTAQLPLPGLQKL